ncbi:MAG TPA: PIN domain-containing protein [Gammaproteobacteria bacterium]|nr:PIN domain-containing protein [Gammaproteobacteria bacterium]
MSAERFFDTNVLLYAFAADDPRSIRAEELLAEGGVVGVQVLNEFTNVTRRKLQWQWDRIESALAVIDELLGPALPLTLAIYRHAVEIARDHTLSFYGGLIVSAAQDAACEVLFSEDLQHGRRFGALTIENPFRP